MRIAHVGARKAEAGRTVMCLRALTCDYRM
jgi:hypothetical protein